MEARSAVGGSAGDFAEAATATEIEIEVEVGIAVGIGIEVEAEVAIVAAIVPEAAVVHIAWVELVPEVAAHIAGVADAAEQALDASAE